VQQRAEKPHRKILKTLEDKGLQGRHLQLIALHNETYRIDFKGNISGLKIPRS